MPQQELLLAIVLVDAIGKMLSRLAVGLLTTQSSRPFGQGTSFDVVEHVLPNSQDQIERRGKHVLDGSANRRARPRW